MKPNRRYKENKIISLINQVTSWHFSLLYRLWKNHLHLLEFSTSNFISYELSLWLWNLGTKWRVDADPILRWGLNSLEENANENFISKWESTLWRRRLLTVPCSIVQMAKRLEREEKRKSWEEAPLPRPIWAIFWLFRVPSRLSQRDF